MTQQTDPARLFTDVAVVAGGPATRATAAAGTGTRSVGAGAGPGRPRSGRPPRVARHTEAPTRSGAGASPSPRRLPCSRLAAGRPADAGVRRHPGAHTGKDGRSRAFETRPETRGRARRAQARHMLRPPRAVRPRHRVRLHSRQHIDLLRVAGALCRR